MGNECSSGGFLGESWGIHTFPQNFLSRKGRLDSFGQTNFEFWEKLVRIVFSWEASRTFFLSLPQAFGGLVGRAWHLLDKDRIACLPGSYKWISCSTYSEMIVCQLHTISSLNEWTYRSGVRDHLKHTIFHVVQLRGPLSMLVLDLCA